MHDSSYVVKRSFAHQSLFQGRKPLLSHLDIELTERCNNACQHCYINLPANDRQASTRELATQQWQEVIRNAAELGALSVRFTGGEPLLRPDFADLYLYTRRLGLKVYLFTNARLVTPDLADLFARVPPLKKIEVTVFGMCPESYDSVTCTPGAFAEFSRGIELLLERRVPFIVKSVLLPPNREEIDQFEDWAAGLPAMDVDPGYAVFLDLRARRDSPAKNKRIRELRFSSEQGVELHARNSQKYQRSMAEYCQKFIGPTGDLLFNCNAGEGGCVDAYGNYQMCMMLRHPATVYDLRQGTLHEALTEFFPTMRKTRSSNPEYLARCALCFLKGMCEQCPAKSWSEHGTLDTPVEYLCEVAHAQARYLGLLAEGERGWEVSDWKPRVAALQQSVEEG